MATNKPPLPKVPYFDGWTWFALLITVCVMPYAISNIEPLGDLPAANWWWYVRLVVLLFGSRWVQVLLIRGRVAPKWPWGHLHVRPWSSPLQFDDGSVLDMMTWYAVSSGLGPDKAAKAINEPGMLHRVKSAYALYLMEFGKEYRKVSPS